MMARELLHELDRLEEQMRGSIAPDRLQRDEEEPEGAASRGRLRAVAIVEGDDSPAVVFLLVDPSPWCGRDGLVG
jgi:hypothetical protein